MYKEIFIMAFQYEILVARNNPAVPTGIIWYRASPMTALGPNLPEILNKYGQQGWEVVATGDLGFDGRNEIILKKEI
jgi:hypothetical protein